MCERHVERAKRLRSIEEPHYNCAQAVFLSFAPECGIDEDIAFRVAENFGGGMRVGAMCGAVTGALMVIGLLGGSDSEREKFMELVSTGYGDLNCASLLQKNVIDPGLEKKPYCDGLVYKSVEAVCKVMNIE